MADIAGVFHWQLSELRELTLDELLDWRARAVAWFNRVHGQQGT